MSGFTFRDRMRTIYIHEKFRLALMIVQIKKSRLTWFGQIKHQPSDDPSCTTHSELYVNVKMLSIKTKYNVFHEYFNQFVGLLKETNPIYNIFQQIYI
ncbi:hypothetical protein IEQ34_002393 [Dendrobium chrysotoxum]|uniref:Uncharacterized protein n=1 Tax=Dendrobium chrysotoxum TaxID=161865 RepID=A0AAV7HKJ8_DENCH|nr:hypothetical protein IEQ34_002393 [Dendrobium chrysotoxum]